MSYIHLDKEALVNLQYSLNREYLRANRHGCYASSTLVQCNTRKYHGLLVTQQPQIDHEWHVLLSTIDETIVENGQSFNLSLRRYQHGNYEPRGHKYIEDYNTEPIPKITYRVADSVLTKELILAQDENRIYIKYTLIESATAIDLVLRPFLAFRGRHSLAKANTYINKKFEACDNGNSWQLYENYDRLYLQLSKKQTFTAVPDWYYNVEYLEELERGYDFLEDLYAPGYFTISLKKGESVIFAAGSSEAKATGFSKKFTAEVAKRTPRKSFENCLINAAQQFIINKPDEANVIAGYPWFGVWGRDTFISLPGLTVATQDSELFEKVIQTQLKTLRDGLFHNTNNSYNSADAPLWFFWTLQNMNGSLADIFDASRTSLPAIWANYGEAMTHILTHFKNGTLYNIAMHENGLIWQGEEGKAVTWMDAVTDGKPITPRYGYAVEINALWYNAVQFALSCAKAANDLAFLADWHALPTRIEKSFNEVFWDDSRRTLADLATHSNRDFVVRPNMVFATSLPFSPISDEQKKAVLEKIKAELLTPRGLRSIAPTDPRYIGHYRGNQAARDAAYHNGTVWAWLTGHFVEGWLRLHGRSALAFAEKQYGQFENCMTEHGISTISEIFDGDPPHTPRGAISQAWSVAEVLRMGWLIEQYKVS